MEKDLDKLQDLLTIATAGLPQVTAKKMFGCHALWAEGNVFALVWKHGRIGVKLPDTIQYQSLLAVAGAEPWRAGPRQMAHWVLIPKSFHRKGSELKTWATKAHTLCSILKNESNKKSNKKSAVKKSTKKGSE